MILNPMVPFILEIGGAWGKGDIKPNGAIYFGIGVVRRVRVISNPMVLITLKLEEQGLTVISNPIVPFTLELE